MGRGDSGVETPRLRGLASDEYRAIYEGGATKRARMERRQIVVSHLESAY